MDRTSSTFRYASFDAEEFADYPADSTDRGPQATRIPYEAFDLVGREISDSLVDPGIQAGVPTEYAKDLAAVNERIARLGVPLRSARKLGEKLIEASRP